MKKATITVTEAESALRANGISIEAATIRDGIEQGAFPFGIAITRTKRVFLISRKKFIEWCDDFFGITVELTEE